MLVATFGPSTAWQGREIIWDVDHFILVGHGAIPAAGVLDYDRRGQLVWAAARVPRLGRPRWTAGRPAGSRPRPGRRRAGRRGSAAAGRARPRELPAWGIVVLIVARRALRRLSIIIGAVVPSLIMRTTETLDQRRRRALRRAHHPGRHRVLRGRARRAYPAAGRGEQRRAEPATSPSGR